jgi:3-methyladenine DNA glycosylase AlkD
MIKQIEIIQSAFEKQANAQKSEQCSKYMRNKFEFYGLTADERKALQKTHFPALKDLPSSERWDFIRECWEKPEREWQYFAIDWLNSWPKSWFNETDYDQLEWLITQKSWWDSVDALASNYLGKWAKYFPNEMSKTINDWRSDDNFWLHRSCLIFQLKFKTEVDLVLLENLIQQFKFNKEFFIQKAIGWSLRQVSKFHPEEVKRILVEQSISGLAYREAAKYL